MINSGKLHTYLHNDWQSPWHPCLPVFKSSLLLDKEAPGYSVLVQVTDLLILRKTKPFSNL